MNPTKKQIKKSIRKFLSGDRFSSCASGWQVDYTIVDLVIRDLDIHPEVYQFNSERINKILKKMTKQNLLLVRKQYSLR